jgi:hypothetical protein
MFKYIIGILTLKRLGLARPLRFIFFIAFVFLAIVALVYTANLFLTLPERTSGHHVQHRSSH